MPFLIEVRRDALPIHGVPLTERTYTIGASRTCDIQLEGPGVEAEHARLVAEKGRMLLFRSEEEGVLLVNGKKVRSTVVDVEDVIGIGDFTLHFVEQGTNQALDLNALRVRIHESLVERLDLAKLRIEELSDEDLWSRCEVIVKEIVAKSYIPPGVDVEKLEKSVLREALGLGPLEELLSDDSITEVMVNGKDKIFVERKGKLEAVPVEFTSNAQVINVISRIVNPIGRRVDESTPMVDARLKDGSRVNAIIPPLAIHGPSITIRKFPKRKLTPKDLIDFGTWTPDMEEFLRFAVETKRNVVVSGGTGSGKTSLLNVLSSFIPDGERVVTIEDSAELKLSKVNLVSLEARPANIEGKGEVPIRDLVKNALRMRPDRIVVGECRSGEALDMLQAMNTGHDGSLTTLHANAPDDAVLRIETMVMMAGFELPVAVIRRQIALAIQLIVQLSRLSDGSRKVTHVSEVTGLEGTEVTMKDVFVFRRTGLDADGRVQGYFTATGYVPKFVEALGRMGIPIRREIFAPAPEERSAQTAA